MAEVAPATSLAVAGHLAEECSVPHRRALHRFDRLLHYWRLDNQRRTAPWLPLCGPGPRLGIARRLDGMAARPTEAGSRGSRRRSGDFRADRGLPVDHQRAVANYLGAYMPTATGLYPL